MGKSVALTNEQLIDIGRRYGSDDVGREATDARARWKRDVDILAEYGFGPERLAAFEGIVEGHASLRASRPDVVATKVVSVDARNAAVTAGWIWVDKVTSLLGTTARTDAVLATQLAEATPTEDSGLATGIGALKALLAPRAGSFGEKARAADRVEEAGRLAGAIDETAGAAATAKAAPIKDTQELDLGDGRIYVTIKDLNAAGRKAIRNGFLRAKRAEYTFNYLKRTGEKTEAKPDPTKKEA